MILKNLEKYNIYLGSKSPRRRELLQLLRIPFHSLVISGIDESYPATLKPIEVPEYLSKIKSKIYLEKLHPSDLIITADTLVIRDDKIYGKPHSADEAYEILRDLSGGKHQVISGVTVASHRQSESFSSITDVHFAHLSDEEIKYYVDTFQPMDKAGAYGIQEWIGGVAVEKINGSFYNVMGLPIHRLFQVLKNF